MSAAYTVVRHLPGETFAAFQTRQLDAYFAWVEANRRAPGAPSAMDEIKAALVAQAGRTARSLTNRYARDCKRRPAYLDMLLSGLSAFDGAKLVAWTKTLCEQASGNHLIRGNGQRISAAGALVYARWRRRFGDRADQARAA